MTGMDPQPSSPRRVSWRWVWLPIIVFGLLRLPTVVHSPGMQDEQWFAVPGWTVWNEGVPRIPYVPTRNRDTLFQDADQCLMALPPALFYVQAPFHAIFPPGYATSRAPLFLAALLTIAITFGLAQSLGASTASATLVATLMAMCRPLMFTGTTVRPDLLSAVCGWICLLLLWRHLRSGQLSPLVAGGFVCGLGGLFHPFALVFAIQAGAVILMARSTIALKLKRWSIFGVACLAAVAMWLPLIVKYPNEFRSQFFANVLDRAGPGLPARLIWPWPALRHHAQLVYEFAGGWQMAFFAIALVAASVMAFGGRPRRESWGLLAMLGSSVFLTAVVAGIHPTKGYWIYPCVWILAGLAIAIDRFRSKPAMVIAAGLMIAWMLPGGGLRTTGLYWTHWGDAKFHGPKFIHGVLDELPTEGLFLADLSYVYDVYLSGRDTMLCQERELYWGDRDLKYEAILLAWEGEDAGWADQYDAVLSKTYGSRELPQTCFVDVFVPRSPTDRSGGDQPETSVAEDSDHE
ncbi:hypothetical protein K227x_00280 [Rubripirellula lacrimiformis]|uniref:Glycosyltransferase RgtA/B/C/D-like domain-containing protein n=1 Tax=Rubripirellula lacrimiformis TaxID=1930273 RepID=A0A517N3E4_9BACT|nr:glycosyltransferase family 39 protein [Rubripirellula lacrimiformis]QDT01661.1 hypothetical protein K227x_00280 [Rubripirellula lacrimiformis]